MRCITTPASRSPASGRAGAPRVLFLGTRGEFSLPPLAALLEAGIPVCAVVVPRPEPSGPGLPPARRLEPPATLLVSLPLLDQPAAPDIVHLAWEREVPVLEAGRLRDPRCRAVLEPYRPDLLCVACFPQILPPAILDWPPLGCVNLHPSLLPAYRGPAPLFWMFRNGESEAGVTVHRMDAEIDAGDILLQEAFPLPEGISGGELQRECARRGARLMVETARGLAAATLAGRKQPPGGSYHSWPGPRDYEAPVTRPARWAFRFIRGVSEWGPVTIPVEGRCLVARQALGYTETGTLRAACVRSLEGWRIQFSPGILDVVEDEG